MSDIFLGYDVMSILMMVGTIGFKLLPTVAYLFIHKKFKTVWTSVMFYASLFAIILEFLRDVFMRGFSITYSEKGALLDSIGASNAYTYTSYVSGALYALSVMGLLFFAINLNKK